MQLSATNAIAPATTWAGRGRPVMTISGVDRARNETAPMRVFARGPLGRYDGYGSLRTALSAAHNLSRGSDRSAVVVERTDTGAYQVFDAVWQYFWGRNGGDGNRAPMRHFHFEDGTPSQYTAWQAGRRIQVEAQNYARSYDGITRWLVDGRQIAEITNAGGRLV